VALPEGVLDMTGTNAVLIVVPIVMLPALALWLGLVMYAGSHPEWKAHRLAREAAARQAAAAGEQVAVPARKQVAGSLAGSETPASPRAA
jgi:hypothetical protein